MYVRADLPFLSFGILKAENLDHFKFIYLLKMPTYIHMFLNMCMHVY